MAIYRGPGGSGDAVNDSSSETRLAVEARDAALAAQAAAEAAQAAAETAETNAQTAETNAETAETNAGTSATNAASSASSASSSASAASTSATSAASSASSASTSATNAASSASSASTSASNASTSATNAASSATTASTAATNAASSASSASTSASTATTKASEASTSATNAASSASSASSSASTATTQAGIATTKASEASTSATNAASSASSASTSATNAASSASSASTSATNAASSATAASSAQSAAEAARDAALSAYDNFDDRYLGPKASDPTLDNDGNALLSGALYFNTTTNVMKVYTGSSWVAAYVSAAGVLLAVNNLSDLNSVSTARTNLGLGTAATTAATDYATAAQGATADTALQPAAIGVSVQGYDANTAKLNAAQSWSAAQSFNAGVTLGDASGDALTINSSAVSIPNGLNFDSNTLVIDATNNRVGVGTASPASPLDILGQATIRDTSTTTTRNEITASSDVPRIDFVNSGTYTMSVGYRGASAPAVQNIGQINVTANSPLALYTNNTERMRITSTGAVGVGTSSPSFVLDVNGTGRINGMPFTSSGAVRLISTHSNSGAMRLVGGADNTASSYIDITGSTYNASSPYITFNNNGAERLRIDSSGNLGLGVTPSAWGASYKSVQVNSGASIVGNTSTPSAAFVGANWYFDGTTDKYIGTDYASRYYQVLGQHRWYTAPSGTAGNAISFTQAMTLDASGNLGIGATSPSGALHIARPSCDLIFDIPTTEQARITSAYGASTGILIFANGTSKTERMRIDSSGKVAIATTSPESNLTVYGTSTAPSATTLSSGTLNIKGSSTLRLLIGTDPASPYGAWLQTTDGAGAGYPINLNPLGGNVGIGTSTPGAKLTVSDGTTNIQVNPFSGVAYFGTLNNYPVAFSTNSGEKARISAAGGFSVGTTADPGAGAIYATGNITAYYSDERLKTKIGNIDNALDKVKQIETMVYHANDTAVGLGYDASVIEVGVTAQSVQKVQPEVVVPAPVDQQYLTVRYDRLVPLLIEAIKELEAQVAELKAK